MKKNPVKAMCLTALFAALTAVGAFLKIPAGTISFTLQVFFTCMAGLLLGPYWGAASQAVYVALGLLGVPIFTEGGGLMYLAKPSFGFLLGLIPMAFTVGLLSRSFSKGGKLFTAKKGWCFFARCILACTAGLVVLYLVGLPYMYMVLGGAWSIEKTILSGCVIFLPFDALKIVISCLLCMKIAPAIQRL